MTMRIIVAGALSLLLSSSVLSFHALSNTEYDWLFRYGHARFLAWHDPDYMWTKAQAIAESALDPDATSPVGAAGLMQLMPGTFNDCRRALRIGPTSRYSPKANVICGTWYMKRCLTIFSSPRSTLQRWLWAFASYNAGPGRPLDAQRKVGGSLEYEDIEGLLPSETQAYTRRIQRLHQGLHDEID